uniref:LOW QUALITY PROTEIN: sorting nexin-11 n=1 Tax=Lonchura striata TaxID=40157 RepID=UPI0012936308|nr:LOW QUALITY PROTEIN: sorting nexin-11 [Lonchura striata domestica]
MSPPHPRAGGGRHLGQHRRSDYTSQHAPHRNFRHLRAIKAAPPPAPLKRSAGGARCFPLGSGSRMLENREEVRSIPGLFPNPGIGNEGSWNSYVDYKIFLHTNSKAFTAKTSCVRRRYREFVWLRRQLQRNAGSVCAGGCLESFPCWSDFGMDEARPDSPARHGVTPPDSPAGQRVTPLDSPEEPQDVRPDME